MHVFSTQRKEVVVEEEGLAQGQGEAKAACADHGGELDVREEWQVPPHSNAKRGSKDHTRYSARGYRLPEPIRLDSRSMGFW